MTKLKLGSITVAVDPFFYAALAAAVLSGQGLKLALAFAGMVFHELGHILVARLFKRELKWIRIMPVGFSAGISENDGGMAESILVSLAGPLANLAVFSITLAWKGDFPGQESAVGFFAAVNIALAAFNLLPVLPLDGGRIVFRLIARGTGFLRAFTRMRKASFFMSFLLICTGIALFLLKDGGIGFALAGMYIRAALKSEEMEGALMNLKHLLYRRAKILKKGVYPAGSIVVLLSSRLVDIIKLMEANRFHLIYVLDDEELKVVGMLTEQQAVKAMTDHGAHATFKDILGVRPGGGQGP